MDLKSLLDLASETLTAFKDHILILLAIIVVTFIIGARWRRSVDDGEIRGVNAENKALKAQLALAHTEQEAVTAQLEKLKPYSGQLATEVAELKMEVARMKTALPQLDRVASTSAVMVGAVDALSAANTALGRTLTAESGRYEVSDTPAVIRLTTKSE